MDGMDALRRAYEAYVDGYRRADGSLPDMMELKLRHTMNVVEAAKAIASGEGFDGRTRTACEAAALLHDTGRYEQLRLYDTFRDSESVDHAVFSHGIVKEKGWLDGWRDKDAILEAVLVHNRREIPAGIEDPLTLACCRTVRDADKLDIFRVLEDKLSNPGWREDRKEFWNLDVEAPPSQAVVSCILSGLPVAYGEIKSLSDFVLIQVGWMASGLEYATSRRICLERGHLEFRRRFLKGISSATAADEVCDFAAEGLRR